jgi:hypothetical protein
MVTSMISTEVEGVVAKVNERGFLLAGRAVWTNLSRFADPRPALPREGDRVRAGLDKSGFARCIQIVDTPATYAGGYRSVADAQLSVAAPGTVPADHPGDRDPASIRPDREVCISRQACLNSAIAVLGSAGQAVEPSAALALAEVFEGWVLR